MEDNQALQEFGQVLVGIYEFMKRCEIPFFGLIITLWDVFLWGMIGGAAVWVAKKLFG